MNDKITIRQLVFLFIFISITPIFSSIPNAAAVNGGESGYISAIYTGILLVIFCFLLVKILHAYPNSDLYEILTRTVGVFLAKVIILCYAVWALISFTYRMDSTATLLQTTLMPAIHINILAVFLFFLVAYGIIKGAKTIFRFSELLYGPVLFFLFLLFVFAVPNFDWTNLVPVDMEDLRTNIYTLNDFLAIAGNLGLILFFSGHIWDHADSHGIKQRMYSSVLRFTLLGLLTILLALGVSGPFLTARFSYPIFQSIKGVALLNTFERFDAFISLICLLSDFAGIAILVLIFGKCISWLFNKDLMKGSGIIALALAASYISIRNITQYNLELLYRNRMIPLNLIFLYVVPVLLGICSLFKSPPKKTSSTIQAALDNTTPPPPDEPSAPAASSTPRNAIAESLEANTSKSKKS
ncbi:MAG: hypothetical protein E7256_01970 [Lachnospiraceae bacterium]|nr:hypothetical protein [Lachnospiraceae bacterium]